MKGPGLTIAKASEPFHLNLILLFGRGGGCGQIFRKKMFCLESWDLDKEIRKEMLKEIGRSRLP